MNKKSICAVIPAAGEGRRLGQNLPKILVPITPGKNIWHILSDKLFPLVNHIHVVLSPKSLSLFNKQIHDQKKSKNVTTSVQEIPRGMGDAIFGAHEYWKGFQHILVIWGDQVYVSFPTLQSVVQLQTASSQPSLTLPVNKVDDPYVQYVFNNSFSSLLNIRQSREGDSCDKNGFADVGVFGLSTSSLMKAWKEYLQKGSLGEKTGEINFLPFLVHISKELKWKLNVVRVQDPVESRGINTPEDLEFFRKKFKPVK